MIKTLTFICLIFCFGLNAQSVELMLTSTESTCADNGTITFTTTLVDGATAASYDYILTKDGMTIAIINNAGNTYTREALAGGDYEVSVTTNTNYTASSTITVASSYQTPELTLDLQNPTCNINNDGVIISNVVGGKMPFTFTLYKDYYTNASTMVGSPNATGEFSDLEPGTYTVVLVDDCNNQTPQTGTLLHDYEEMVVNKPTLYYADCTSYGLKSSYISGGDEPFEFRITPNGNPTPWQSSDVFTFSNNYTDWSSLTYQVKDACGNMVSQVISEPNFNILQYVKASDFDPCDAKLEFRLANHWRIGETYDYTVTYEENGNTVVESMGSTTRDVFVDPAVPGRTYTVTYTNECGESWSESNTHYSVDAVRTIISDGQCEIGESRVRIFFDNSNLPMPTNNGNVVVNKPTFTLTSYPSGYSGDISIYINSSTSSLYLNSYNNGLFVPGHYEYTLVENGCDTGVSGSFDISTGTALSATIESTVIPSCGDDNQIHVEAMTTNYVNYDKFDLYAANGTTQLVDGALDSGSNPPTATFYNLAPGTYVVKFRKCNSPAESSTVSQTVIIDEIPDPSIEEVTTINCDAQDNLSISIISEGFGPFQYQVLDGPNNGTTYPTGWQDDPILGSYPLGTYTIQVKDACDNIITQNVTGSATITPGIDLLDTECGSGSQVFTVSNPVPNATYTWSTSNNDSGSGTEITLSSGTPYSVTVSAELGTCATGSQTIQYDGTCEERPFPVKWLTVSAKQNEDVVDVKWTTANEENASHFVVEHSINDGNWTEVESIKAYNNWGENTYYSTHRNPSSGINLYRIKQIDFDGQYDYSNVVSAKISEKNNSKIIVSNPVVNILNLNMESVYGLENIDFEIMGADGRLVKTIQSNLIEENSWHINVQDFPSGIYMLIVRHNNSIINSSKFIKS